MESIEGNTKKTNNLLNRQKVNLVDYQMFRSISYKTPIRMILSFKLLACLALHSFTQCNSQLVKPNPMNQMMHQTFIRQDPQPVSGQASTRPALNLNLTHNNRPIDRPTLTRVTKVQPLANYSVDSGNREPPGDWFLLGGEEMVAHEGKNVATYEESPRNSSIRRSGSHSKRKNSASKNKTLYEEEQADSSDSNEIFDDVDEASGTAGIQKEPECAANGRYYCTFKEEYPLKLVTEVTKYYKWPLEKLFRDLHAQIMPKLAQDSTGNLVCDSITRVVRPGWARNTNEKWLVVINTENYHQYVTEVVCQYGTNSRCNFIPPCYYSSCQQRYNTQKLLVIDPSNPYRGPFLSEFLFPSCCVCYVPSTSSSYQDKYRSSPANIYQRTLQQESNSNLYPPQFKPLGLLDEQQAMAEQSSVNPTRFANRQSSSSSSSSANHQPLGPGEIRRAGEPYKSNDGACVDSRCQANESKGNQEFPRLGISDSLISSQQSTDAIPSSNQQQQSS